MNRPSQGTFHVRRRLDGSLYFRCPPEFVLSPQQAVDVFRQVLKEAGVETIMADPGQTVIRAPKVRLFG